VSHIVEVAANIAQAASTAFPPRVNVMAPALAASGLPVMATQCLPCKTGFAVFCAQAGLATDSATKKQTAVKKIQGLEFKNRSRVDIMSSCVAIE
jgi:hypothetical protein